MDLILSVRDCWNEFSFTSCETDFTLLTRLCTMKTKLFSQCIQLSDLLCFFFVCGCRKWKWPLLILGSCVCWINSIKKQKDKSFSNQYFLCCRLDLFTLEYIVSCELRLKHATSCSGIVILSKHILIFIDIYWVKHKGTQREGRGQLELSY